MKTMHLMHEKTAPGLEIVDCRPLLKKAKMDRKGEMTSKAVSIIVALFVVATIAPIALVQIANATLTGVDPAVQTIFTILLPVLAIVAVVMMFLRK